MSAIDVIALPGHPGMFARRVAVQAWQSAGSPPVNSAGRLYAEQKRMYDGWREGLPGFNPADNPDDETQRLAHVRFVAFDIDPTADRIKRLTEAGFIRPYTYEPWHWELPNVRSYALVRSIPAAASLNITPIETEQKEDDDMPIRIEAPNRGQALVGPGYFRPLSPANDLEEVKAANQIITRDPLVLTDARFDTIRDILTTGGSVNPKPIVDAVMAAITTAGGGTDRAAIAAAVDAALSDNFAAIPAAVIDATAAQYNK